VFIESSRYFQLKIVDAKSGDREVKAVTLRRLPFVGGTPTIIKSNDRLDVIAQRRYTDATRFWHIADANTELEANDLTKPKPNDPTTRTILVPDK
jgi:hypothetical protein